MTSEVSQLREPSLVKKEDLCLDVTFPCLTLLFGHMAVVFVWKVSSGLTRLTVAV